MPLSLQLFISLFAFSYLRLHLLKQGMGVAHETGSLAYSRPLSRVVFRRKLCLLSPSGTLRFAQVPGKELASLVVLRFPLGNISGVISPSSPPSSGFRLCSSPYLLSEPSAGPFVTSPAMESREGLSEQNPGTAGGNPSSSCGPSGSEVGTQKAVKRIKSEAIFNEGEQRPRRYPVTGTSSFRRRRIL